MREWHRATGKQTLASIAKRYGVNEVEVAALAGLPLGATPAKGVRVPIPSREARYSLIPEARGLPIPDAPPLPDAALVKAPVTPPPEQPSKGKALVARVDDRPKVKLVSLTVSALAPTLPAVDALAGADLPPLGEVDVIAGDPGVNAPWPLDEAPAGEPRDDALQESGVASPPTS